MRDSLCPSALPASERGEREGGTGGEGRGPKLSRARITTVTFWKRNKKGEV